MAISSLPKNDLDGHLIGRTGKRRTVQQRPPFRNRIIPLCCVTVIAALYIVGLVSNTELRHVVQTLPLWLGAILGYFGVRMARWVVLPVFLIWFALMSLVWLYLLGWAHVIHGHFSATEIAMTLIVGISSVFGIASSVRGIRSTSLVTGSAVFLLSAGFQLAMLYVSF